MHKAAPWGPLLSEGRRSKDWHARRETDQERGRSAEWKRGRERPTRKSPAGPAGHTSLASCPGFDGLTIPVGLSPVEGKESQAVKRPLEERQGRPRASAEWPAQGRQKTGAAAPGRRPGLHAG